MSLLAKAAEEPRNFSPFPLLWGDSFGIAGTLAPLSSLSSISFILGLVTLFVQGYQRHLFPTSGRSGLQPWPERGLKCEVIDVLEASSVEKLVEGKENMQNMTNKCRDVSKYECVCMRVRALVCLTEKVRQADMKRGMQCLRFVFLMNSSVWDSCNSVALRTKKQDSEESSHTNLIYSILLCF